MSIDEIIDALKQKPTKHVTVTGGEPLAQQSCIPLLIALSEQGFKVSLETSGAFDISEVAPRVMIVMDLKTPDSNESSKNLLSNIPHLKQSDQIKFVICSRADYLWTKQIIEDEKLDGKVDLLMSPSWEQQSLADLADWMLEDGLNVRFQTQLHKVIWPNSFGPGV